MAEYVNREGLLRKFDRLSMLVYSEDLDMLRYSMERIKEYPISDVAPVVHGRWVAVDGDGPCDEWDCTACGQRRTFMCEMDADDMKEFYPYCPHCGAKMDGTQ